MSVEIIESLRADPSSHDLRASFMAIKQDYYELYTDVLVSLQQRVSANTQNKNEYAEKAFQITERARARSLLETLAEARMDIRQGANKSLLEKEYSLQSAINAKATLRQTLQNEKDKEQISKLDKEINELRIQLNDVRGKIRAESPNYAALTQVAPLSLSGIQKLLDDETILLEYTLGENRSWLWLVTKNSFEYYELPKRVEIETSVRNVYDSFKSPQAKNEAAILRDSTKLSQMLLGKVAGRLGKKRLLIVGDGVLQYLPFAALPQPANNAQPLIVSNEIVNMPSASTLGILRKDSDTRVASKKTLAIFADPVFSSNDERFAEQNAKGKTVQDGKSESAKGFTKDGSLERSVRDMEVASFQRLFSSREEATEIISMLPAEQRAVSLDFKASRSATTSADLREYRIVHFATHGLLNSVHPELSGLVFSLIDENGQKQDGFLRLQEIYNLKLNADLVVLSACQTALGKNVKGEGLISLTRGFMYAGATRVVASLWRVSDRATSELMKRFYQAMLKGGMKPAAALREAQISMWRQERWRAVNNWAGFILQGEWR